VNGSLTNSLGGVQVLFNNLAAPLLYAGPNQINAIVPSGVTGGTTTTVQVGTPDGRLVPRSIKMEASILRESCGGRIRRNDMGHRHWPGQLSRRSGWPHRDNLQLPQNLSAYAN